MGKDQGLAFEKRPALDEIAGLAIQKVQALLQAGMGGGERVTIGTGQKMAKFSAAGLDYERGRMGLDDVVTTMRHTVNREDIPTFITQESLRKAKDEKNKNGTPKYTPAQLNAAASWYLITEIEEIMDKASRGKLEDYAASVHGCRGDNGEIIHKSLSKAVNDFQSVRKEFGLGELKLPSDDRAAAILSPAQKRREENLSNLALTASGLLQVDLHAVFTEEQVDAMRQRAIAENPKDPVVMLVSENGRIGLATRKSEMKEPGLCMGDVPKTSGGTRVVLRKFHESELNSAINGQDAAPNLEITIKDRALGIGFMQESAKNELAKSAVAHPARVASAPPRSLAAHRVAAAAAASRAG